MDGDASTLLGACLLAFLLILNFIMTAFSAAIRSVSDTEIQEAFESEGKPPDEICEMKDHSDRLIHTIWLLTAVTYTATGYFLTGLTRRYPIYVTLPLLAILFYLFGNSIPEMLGHKNASRWLLHRSGVVRVVMLAVSPLTYIMTFVSHVCVRILGIDPKSFESEVTEDEIISMVNEGHEQGVLDAREAEMIQNIFEMDDKKAGDIMIHRKNIIGIDGAQDLNAALAFMVEQPLSRFPVYLENIDNIIGILHFKDAMKFHTMGKYDNWLIKDIPELIREAAEKFGSQCVVVAIDAKRREDGSGWNIYKNGGRIDMGIDAVEWAKKVEALGAGEILLTSMDCDGTKAGYDLELTRTIAENVSIPVIASGGAGNLEHFYEALGEEGKADAALAASLFHYKELEIREVKEYLREKGVSVRL